MFKCFLIVPEVIAAQIMTSFIWMNDFGAKHSLIWSIPWMVNNLRTHKIYRREAKMQPDQPKNTTSGQNRFIFRIVSQNMKAATWAYRHDGVCQCHAIWQTWVDVNLVYLIIIISLQILFMTYLPLKVVWLGMSVTQRNLFIHGGFILFIHSIHSFIHS